MKRFVVRLSTLSAMLFAVLSGGALFWVSQQVQQLEHEQRLLKQDIANEKEGIRVLNAEWDYLNRPDRLEALVSQHLRTMSPVVPEDLLRDASAVPEPKILASEDERTVLVSTNSKQDTKTKPKNAVRAVPDARPITTPSPNQSDQFDKVLNNITGGDE